MPRRLYPAERIVEQFKRELLRDYAGSVPAAAHDRDGRAFPPRLAAGSGCAASRMCLPRAAASGIFASTKQVARQPIQTGQSARSCPAGPMASTPSMTLCGCRDTPGVVDQTILAVTQQDGRGVCVRIEQQIGTGGVFQASGLYSKLLVSFDYKPVKPTGEKSSRWRPLSVQAEGGNVWLAEGSVERCVRARTLRLAWPA